MTISTANFVRETTTTSGTGTYNLDGASDQFQTFVQGVGDGAVVYYSVFDNDDFEVGRGTVTIGNPDKLSRDNVLESTNADAAVDWPASGTRTVALVLPAGKDVPLDENDNLPVRWFAKSAAYTASSFDHILADTSGGAFTITLPASPATGDEIWFVDAGRSWDSNNLTVDGNGNNILGASTFTADRDDQPFSLVYNGTQWILGMV